jgi:hypothetical protein
MSIEYRRVIPRDLFNEGDLLNCLGRLWIKLDERRGHRAMLDCPCGAFDISQSKADGSIEALGVDFFIRNKGGPGEKDYRLFRPLNARDKWPLYASIGDEDVRVFDEQGELSPEFRAHIGL